MLRIHHKIIIKSVLFDIIMIFPKIVSTWYQLHLIIILYSTYKLEYDKNIPSLNYCEREKREFRLKENTLSTEKLMSTCRGCSSNDNRHV